MVFDCFLVICELEVDRISLFGSFLRRFVGRFFIFLGLEISISLDRHLKFFPRFYSKTDQNLQDSGRFMVPKPQKLDFTVLLIQK